MSDDVFEYPADQPGASDVSEFLRGQIGLVLTERQVGCLVGNHGLVMPVGAWLSPLPLGTDEDEQVLGDLGIVEDGVPTEWFLSLWRTVTAPAFLVTVDRLIAGKPAEWVYLIDRATFAEQVKSVDGWTWLFGVHQELLARILLNIGLLRFRKADGPTLDPFPSAEAWASVVTIVERSPDGSPSSRSARFSCDGDTWTISGPDGSAATASPAVVGDSVATLLDPSLGQPAAG